ncbi:short chain dehydrogenase [Falsochrobactrum shanghaiense]|uniref:Short chain dehydrogenase n=1 Tax=Falsochrobactrum shanghaiense TaxID=2201899 RepID=A0A316J3G3_9HYPH|nr:SDR family oxidoreductase [Falsochrobactrum shanghaiense]PWL16472.1 short chain dehydrogenase [Falsochrobactrum shanghaiense]
MQLKDKVTLIVGGATGIGEGIVKRFASEGSKVVVADVNTDQGNKVVAEICANDVEASFFKADVSAMPDLENMVQHAVDTYGGIDIFWHNAGISNIKNIEEITEQDFDRVMAINLKAAVFGAKFVVPHMKKSGGGSMIFTASVSGMRPSPLGSIAYSVSKAGIIMLVRNLATYLGKYNIRVNAIAPWGVWTEMTEASLRKGDFEENKKNFVGKMPLGQFVSVDEIANAGLFLASAQAGNITGVCLPVDGGLATI